jgi:hypothetical protein
MIKRMEQLISGKWDADQAALLVVPENIEDTAAPGSLYHGTFHVSAEDRTPVRGFASVDHPRITMDDLEFSGRDNAITFTVNLNGLKAGERVEAILTLVTSLGESQHLIIIDAEETISDAFPSSVRNLDDFVSLAQNAYSEAYQMFGQKEFIKLLQNEPDEIRSLYKALSRHPLSYQRMEEFLVSADRKDPVRLEVPQKEAAFFKLRETVKNEWRLIRNTWGHLNFHIEVVGDFIEVQKRQLTDEDFVGSICNLEYIIHSEKIGNGRHFGAIILRSAYQTFRLDITVSHEAEHHHTLYIIKKRNHLKLEKLLVDYSLGHISLKEFNLKTITNIAAIREMGEMPVGLTLYEAYVRYISDDRIGMKNLLRSLENHDFSDDGGEVKGAFLFLCDKAGLLAPGHIDVKERLGDWYRRSQESFVLLYLLMQSDNELSRTPVHRIMLFEDLFGMGCRSPFLYIEALKLLREDSSLLKRLNRFTRKLLSYGAKEHFLTEELVLRAAGLSYNEKTFSKEVYYFLTKSYEDYPSKTLVEAICRLIMKGNPRRQEYFKWYEAAIDAEVRMTRLYEYYIETIPETYQNRLPSPVRKYFLMNSSLGSHKLAFIYANIIRNKDKDEETYKEYLPLMQKLTARALIKGLINRDFAALYQEFYKKVSDFDVCRALTRVMYTELIICGDSRVKDVVVHHETLKNEMVVPLKDGKAYVPVYSDDSVILFQDEVGRRFAAGVSYSRRKLMETQRLTQDCLREDVEETGFLLRICGHFPDITFENLNACRAFAGNEAFTKDARLKMNRRLLDFYKLYAGDERLTGILLQLDEEDFAKEDRKDLAEIFVYAGLFDRAYDMILKYGTEGVGISYLVRLVSHRIAAVNGEEDPNLLSLVWLVYRQNKYNDRILKYLATYLNSSLETMMDLREHVSAFYMESYGLDERILMQAMFVRQHLKDGGKLLQSYRREGGKAKVSRAYVIFEANECLLNENPLDDYLASLIIRAYEEKADMPLVCKLALLSWYGEKENYSDEDETNIEDLLEEMTRRGIRFEFFRKLPRELLAGCSVLDRVFVEQKAQPDDYVVLHYQLSRDGRVTRKWSSEPMMAVYRGIYSREFILFYGETLNYYITIERDGEVRKLPEMTLSQKDVDISGQSRYQLINQMLKAHAEGSEAELNEKISEYTRRIHQAEVLFTIDENDDRGEGLA